MKYEWLINFDFIAKSLENFPNKAENRVDEKFLPKNYFKGKGWKLFLLFSFEFNENFQNFRSWYQNLLILSRAVQSQQNNFCKLIFLLPKALLAIFLKGVEICRRWGGNDLIYWNHFLCCLNFQYRVFTVD